jgi:hypothetical protein
MVQISHARHLRQTCLHASTGVTGYRSANCPRRSAIGLSWTTLVPRSGSPYPGLTLPPDVCRRRTCTMPHKAVEKPKVTKLPARHTLYLSETLADCGWQPAHSRRRFSMVQNRSHRSRATFANRNQLRSRIRTGAALLAASVTLSTPATGASTDAGRHALGPEHTPFREHRLRCVDVHACCRGVYFGRGDAERARI